MSDLVMRKRPAMHAGEVGLFIDSQVFESDFEHIRTGVDLQVKATQPRNLKQLRLAWALAGKIAQSGTLGDADKDEVMDYLLKRAKHVKYIYNKHRDGEEIEAVVKSIRFAAMEQDAFNRLFNRMLWIVTSDILPDVPMGTIREEIEAMAGVGVPETEQKPASKRRGRPPKVSVIPPAEPAGHADAQPAPAASAAGAASPAAHENAAPAPDPSIAVTNVQGWKDFCKAWLDEIDDDAEATDVDVLTRWTSETKLRNRCGVTAEDRQGHFAYMNAIVEKKREAQKAI